ncbi:MAG TPA: hypothetical protein VFE39_12880, partial [Pseudonocardia sp.]|nr:hypothetical protein [Pseudonocardia sp.]
SHTIALRANVAGCAALLGRWLEAAAGFERAAADSAAVLGHQHPDTVALQDDLRNVHDPAYFAIPAGVSV